MKIAHALILMMLLSLPLAADVEADSAAASSMGEGEFSPTDPPLPAPEVAVTARDGRTVRLAELRGRPVLINLWATWCAPCVREMPSLERLAAERGQSLTVMAISEDRRGEQAVAPFVDRHGLAELPIFLDSKSDVAHAFGVDALPTTILIDSRGREVGRYLGPAAWDGAAARRLIDRLLAPLPPGQKSAQR